MPKPAPSQYAPPPVLRAKVPWDHSAGTMAFSAPASMKKTPEPISECPHLRRFHTNHKACVTNHGHRNYSIWKETKKAPLAPWSLSMERTKPLCECRAAANGRRPLPPCHAALRQCTIGAVRRVPGARCFFGATPRHISTRFLFSTQYDWRRRNSPHWTRPVHAAARQSPSFKNRIDRIARNNCKALVRFSENNINTLSI